MGVMAGTRKVSIAWVVSIAAIASAGAAHAQAQAQPIGGPPVFRVQITTTQPGVTVRLRGPLGDVDCDERCVLNLPLSTYKMIVKDADGHLSTQRLDVTMPLQATVTPPDHTTRTAGIVSGLVGVAAAAVGAVVLLVALWLRAVERIDCGGSACTSDDVPNWLYYAGGISVGAGLAVGLTGLIVWRRNAHADVRVEAFAPPMKDARVRVVPAAGREWAGLALIARF
jgi:hypothetical protein